MTNQQLIAPVEIWKPITPDIIPYVKPYYLVSSLGRVYSTLTNKILKTAKYEETGYIHVGLRTEYGSTHVLLHRLVMMIFYPIPNMDKYEVNHMYDGNKEINTIYNLEWCSRQDNINHAWENELYHVGEDHHNAKLTNDEVHIICQGLVQNLPYEVIASNINKVLDKVLSSTISDIKAGRRWAHISSAYVFPTERSYQLLSENQIHGVCRLLEQNVKMNQIDILNIVGVDTSSLDSVTLKKYIHCVDRIRRRDRFVNISKDYNF